MPTNLTPTLTFFQAQPFLKNSHLISHLLVYNNQQVIFFSDKALHVYSYQQMLRDQAAFVHVVEFEKMFSMVTGREEKGRKRSAEIFHVDKITQVFNSPHNTSTHNNVQQKQFGQRIFSDPDNINSNILLKGQHFINRLIYLNSVRVKSVKLSAHGDLLINFINGQTIFLQRDNSIKYYKNFNAVDLNTLVKQKVQQSCFIEGTNNLLLCNADGKVCVYDYLVDGVVAEMKYLGKELVNGIKAFSLCGDGFNTQSKMEPEKLIVMFQHPHELQFYELAIKKKKLISLAHFQLPQAFIQTVFLYDKLSTLYAATSQTIYKLDLKQLYSPNQPKNAFQLMTKISRSKSKSSQKSSNSTLHKTQTLKSEIIAQFQPQSPQQMLYISPNGGYIPKCTNTSKQYTNLIYETQLGTFFAVTCKKQGNYKEGQLLIGVQSDLFQEMIKKSIVQIKNLKSYEYLNFDDLSVVTQNSKLKKETVSKLSKFFNETYQKFSQLDIQKGLQIEQQQSIIQVFGLQMSQSEFQILLINLGYIFESKQGVRQKHIEKRIVRHYQEAKGQRSEAPRNIKQRCIFTHKEIGEESAILECKVCDVYGIKQRTDDPNVWEDGLRNGLHRCYVCMNEMHLL